jgi:hypothetical protein
MEKMNTTLACCAALVFLALPVDFNPVRDPAEVSKDPQERWETLSPGEKKELLKRYRRYQSMPEYERKRLKERHRKLRIMRESFTEEEKSETMNQAEVDGKIRKYLKRCEQEVRKKLKLSGGNPDEPRPARIQRLRKKLESANLGRERLGRFLKEMVRKGVVTSREAEKIKSLPGQEKKRRIFALQQKSHLKEMEGLLPAHEIEVLEEQEPWRFHRRTRMDRERWGAIQPWERLMELTPEQEKNVENLPSEWEREQTLGMYRTANLRKRLILLGADENKVEEILSKPLPMRQRWIMRRIKALKKKGPPCDPAIEKILESLSVR